MGSQFEAFVFITGDADKHHPIDFKSSSLQPSFFKIKSKSAFVFNYAKFVPAKTFTIW
jgi:hypothetical protein